MLRHDKQSISPGGDEDRQLIMDPEQSAFVDYGLNTQEILKSLSESDREIVRLGLEKIIDQYVATTDAIRTKTAMVKTFPVAQKAVQISTEKVSEHASIESVRARALKEAKELVSAYAVYTDATLAGIQARHELDSNSHEDKALAAYHEVLLSCGHDEQAANDALTKVKAEWESLSEQAEKKFFDSVLPGDIMLEHYTPYALGPIRGDGLRPKDEHAVTSVNRRSRFVHFTTRGDVAGAWGTDISSYTGVRAQTLRKMDEDPDLTPISGMFTVPLASAIEGGLRAAHFTRRKSRRAGLQFQWLFAPETDEDVTKGNLIVENYTNNRLPGGVFDNAASVEAVREANTTLTDAATRDKLVVVDHPYVPPQARTLGQEALNN